MIRVVRLDTGAFLSFWHILLSQIGTRENPSFLYPDIVVARALEAVTPCGIEMVGYASSLIPDVKSIKFAAGIFQRPSLHILYTCAFCLVVFDPAF